MGAFPQLGQDAAGWELAMLGGRTKRWSKSQGGKYGDQRADTANSMAGQTPGPEDIRARGHQDLTANPGKEEEALQGAATSTLGVSPSSLSKVSWRCRG